MRTAVRIRTVLALLLISALFPALLPLQAAGNSPLTVTHELDWGSQGLGPGEFEYPIDVAVDKWGTVYVSGAGDSSDDHRIQVFSSDGVLLDSVGTTGTAGTTVLEQPRSVTTDRWGFVYVGEKGNGGRVSVFFPGLYGGGHARTWSGGAPVEEQITDPRGVAVALDGTVYTAETNLYHIQRRTSSGGFLNAWTSDSVMTGVGVSHDGEVFVAHDHLFGTNPDRILVYDAFGGYLRQWGEQGTGPGEFDRPYDVGVDGGGNVFVIDSGNHRGQVFTPAGAHLATFGSVGSTAGKLNGPYGIGVGFDRTLYVADTFNHRISKWSVATPATTAEVAGANRYATAKAASQKAFPTPSQSEYAVVATGLNWPDALGGAALAGALKAPLLLTDPSKLSAEVVSEIARLKVQEIYVLGGTAAVSTEVYNDLATLVGPGDIDRLAGANRYETANEIAAEVVWAAGPAYDGTAFVATGKDFPDALAISPIAAANGWPIFLTEPNSLPASVKKAMQTAGANHGYVAGGTSAVSGAVFAELNAPPFVGFTRYGGANRYATAATVAEAGFDGMGMLWSRPAIATGENFPDALAGGVLQGSDCSVMLLTPKNYLHPAASSALSKNRDAIYELRFLGGTGAVSTPARQAARALLW